MFFLVSTYNGMETDIGDNVLPDGWSVRSVLSGHVSPSHVT